MAVEYHFVTEPQKNRFCPVCFELLTEPFLNDCGHHLCRQCRTQLLADDKKECPECREHNVLPSARLNKFLQREINDLKVRCQHDREGCRWTGEVRDLQSHLDPEKRKCGYILLPCSFGCGERIRRGAMRKHMKSSCTKRQMSCQYCSYCSSYDIVSAKHLPICLQVPVICPNNCKEERLKRKRLQAHIDVCPLQVISCPFTSAGCTVKLPRNEMEKHEDTAMRQHLRLVLMKLQLKQEPSTPPAVTVSPPFLYNQAPMEFIISDFSEKKEADEEWISSPFYTHSRGYRFHVDVYPNDVGTDSGSHLSVAAALMRGKYDIELEWPFEGDIRFELLNWRADKNHHSVTIPFNRCTDPDGTNTSRVTSQATTLGLFDQFISHTDLVPTTNTEFFRDDYLKLRVSVAVYSTSFLSLTPAWQDSFSTTQSGAQFTISEYSKRKQFNNEYYSPPFTTSPQGYRLCLNVDANGSGSSKGSQLSVFVVIMKGQHDNRLQWPFTGIIIIELLNWLEDKGHYKMTLPIGTNNGFVRVTEGEYGNATGDAQFISQSSLNSSTNPQYLYQDCIRVRVQAIAEI